MTTKNKLLHLLENHRETVLSGQELADKLNVSRTSVWKAIKKLQEEGYIIESLSNKGYRLCKESDVLSQNEINDLLEDSCVAKGKVIVYKSIDSTNNELKKQAIDGALEGTVLVSDEQTAGKGRMGRNFYSPKGTGIYISMLMKPKMTASDAVLITTAASVALCRAIRGVTNLEPEIKWVNDVYLRGKKICGILTEAVTSFETGAIDSVICGIGINYKIPPDGFPKEIADVAGALCDGEMIPRNILVARLIEEFYQMYESLPGKEFIQNYKEWSMIIGEDIKFREKEQWYFAKAMDIDDQGGLVVKMEDGTMRTLRTGEITVRKL